MNILSKKDKDIYQLIECEENRQIEGLEMIPSENYISLAVREAVSSVLENKYAEGYPGKRYYTGNKYVDQVERLCIERAKKLFSVEYVNVQPHSGSPANLAIYNALIKKNGISLSQHLEHGGHLSMGQDPSITGRFFKNIHYKLDKSGEVNYNLVKRLAKKYKPKLIWSGGTAYTKIFNWKKYAEIADSVDAYFVADISHISGLIAGKVHPSPVNYAHIMMTTTHKTLRGPRGAMIMITEKGMKKDPDLPKKINKSVFPGLQGGPHMANIAGIAVALKEASNKNFRHYAAKVVENACVLAEELKSFGFTLIGNGSENHMIWLDLRNKNIDGWQAHITLEQANIFGNKQTIPNDSKTPYYPSGFRLGTPAITTRGMKAKQMIKIAQFINEAIMIARDNNIKEIESLNKITSQNARKKFKNRIKSDKKLKKLKEKVIKIASKFPLVA